MQWTVELWNPLAQEVVEAGSISTLRTVLNNFMANRFVARRKEKSQGCNLKHPLCCACGSARAVWAGGIGHDRLL